MSSSLDSTIEGVSKEIFNIIARSHNELKKYPSRLLPTSLHFRFFRRFLINVSPELSNTRLLGFIKAFKNCSRELSRLLAITASVCLWPIIVSTSCRSLVFSRFNSSTDSFRRTVKAFFRCRLFLAWSRLRCL